MDSGSVDQHAYELRRFIKGMDVEQVVLVTHGNFLHYLTQDWSDHPGQEGGTGWKKIDFKNYRLVEGEEAHLQELDESRERRVKEKETTGGFIVKKNRKMSQHKVKQ